MFQFSPVGLNFPAARHRKDSAKFATPFSFALAVSLHFASLLEFAGSFSQIHFELFLVNF